MRKTRLGSRSSAWQARDTLDRDLRQYQQDTGQDYYFNRQLFENLRNEYENNGLIDSVIDHFKDNWFGSALGGAIGAGIGFIGGPIGSAIGGTVGAIAGSNTTPEDVANSLRGIADRWTGGKISADKHNLGLLSRENEDLAKIKDYINLVEQYKTEQDDKKAADILKRILEYDNYFMGEGRSHAPIAQLMFDIDRVPDEYRTGAKTAEFLEYVRSNRFDTNGMKKPLNLSDVWDNFTTGLTDVSNIFGNAVASVTASVSYLANKVDAPKYISNKALMSGAGKEDDFMAPYLKMMYRGGDSVKDIEEEVDAWIKYNEDKGKELTWDLKANEWAKINGMARVPFSRYAEQIWNNPKKLLNLVPFVDSPGWSQDGGAWLNIWDPEDMSKEWKNAQKEHSGQFWHPLYMLPELGSTLGLAQGMVYTMGLNAVSLYIINKIPTVAKNLAGKGKFVKYGSKILSSVPYLLTAVRSGEIAKTFDILSWLREIETSLEAEEGVSSRLLNLAFEDGSGVDSKKVMSSILDYVQNVIGVDTSDMEPQDLIGYAVAFDIDTGDPVFEDAKKKSVLGLNKLMNANNALALHDYIETIPWLSYGGHVMQKFSKMLFDSMSKYYVPIRPSYMPMASRKGFGQKMFGSYWQSPNKLWNDIRNNWDSEITARALSRSNPAVNKLAKEYSNAMYFARNSVIDNIAGHFISKDRIIRGLTVKHIGDHLKGIAKRSLITGIVEGLEEGQQLVLQQRFQLGLYDDYTTPYSLFNIPEAVLNVELGKYSIEALFGMHDHGDDEIRKAMAIGFFISPLMGGMLNIASNVTGNKQYDNLRNLIGQLRTDKVLGSMVGDNFKDREDYEHMSLFYEALGKHGVTIDRLVRSLNDLKLGVDENNSLVEKKYIDDDIRHAIAVNTLYNSEDHKKALKDAGIEEGTDLYKNAVIQNAKVLVDVEDELRNLIDKKQDKIKYILHIKDTVSKLNDPSISEEAKQELRDENPEIVLTLSQISLFYDKYVSAINDWKSQTFDARKRGFDSLTDKQLASLTHPDPKMGTWLSMFLDTPVTVAAGEALLESDKDTKEEFIDFLLNQDPTLNKERFIDLILTMWEVNVALNKAKQLRNDLSNHRDNHLLKFRKLTGKDIDIFKINGYVDSIDDIIAEQEQLELQYTDWLDRIYTYDKKNSIQRAATLNDFFSGEMDLPLNNDASFSNLVVEEMMHNAAFDNLNILRNAILNLESTTPQLLSNVINGVDNVDEVFKTLIEEYKKLEEEEKLDQLDRREGFDIRAEKQKIRRKAALEYLMKNAKDTERRKYIAHQGIISDEIDSISDEEHEETILGEESATTVETPEESRAEGTEAEPEEPESENGSEEEEQPESEEPDAEPIGEEDEEDFHDDDDYLPDTNPRGEEEDDTQSYLDNYNDVDLPEEQQEDASLNRNDANQEEDPHRNDANQEDVEPYRNDAPIDTDDYLDFEFLDYLNDTWLYNGEELDPSRINPLLAMLQHLVNLAQGFSAEAYDAPGRSHDANDIQVMSDLGYSKNLLSLTFFYDPDPRKKDGTEDNTPTILRHNGVDLKLKYKLGTSRQLAKRLLDKGFFKNATKYYVVTVREEVLKYINEHPELSELEKKDLYTVALVIEDDENKLSYATFLRDLGSFETEVPTTNPITGEQIKERKTGEPLTHMRKVNNNQKRMEEYEQHGIRRTLETSESVAAKINNQAADNLIAMWKLSNNETLSKEDALNYVTFKYTLELVDNESEDSYNKRVQNVRSAILQARQTARQLLKIKGKKILTYSEIDYMIDKLRNNRNVIIDAYTTKAKRANLEDGDVITTVTPAISEISNGRFDNISRNDGNGIYVPVLRSVAREGNPFGVGTTVAELSKLIFDGSIRLGYGTGLYFTNSPFNIIDIRSDHQGSQYSKGGIAGKIFLTVTTVNGTRIPMMLVEQRLNTQHSKTGKKLFIQSPADVQLAIDPSSGKITNKDYNPSIAEALLYMMFGRLSSEHIPGDPVFSKDTQLLLADFIVNKGTKTLLANEKIEKMLPYYAAKQLSIKDGVLSIGMPVLKNGLPTGEYHITRYKEDEIFSNLNIRKDIVAAIATQMHWNTEKRVMELKFGDSLTDRLVEALKHYFQNNNADEISICGIPELTFKKDELFESGRNGKPRRVIPNTMIASWLMINEKLSSDVSDDVFYAPFVFADGVNEDPIVLNENSDDSIVDLQDILNNTALVLSVQGYNKDATEFIVNDDIYKQKVSDVDAAKNTERYKAHGARVKTILLDMSSYRKDKYTNKEDFINDVKEKAQKLISTLDEHKLDLRLREGASLLLGERVYQKALADSAMKAANGDRDTKKAIPVVDIHEDGTVLISFFSYSGIGSASLQYVNGVFSTERQSSSINEQEAREWLANTLGIKNRNILVTDAVLKSVLDDDVYGLMELVYDSITAENEARFVFRRLGGKDLEFHEAWHYVNLLIHDAKTRELLWNEYAKEKGLHGKGLLNKEIEEKMGDDYMAFERNLLNHPFSSKIKIFFRNVGEFLHVIKNRPAYEKVYYNIHRGVFKNAKLDPASVKEFKKRYNGVVFSLDILGLNRATADKIAPVIKDTGTFYKVSDAIVDYALYVFDITTADKLRYLVTEDGFKELKLELEDLKETLDEQKAKLLLTFIDSPDAIFHAISSRFKDLGINVKLKEENRKEAKEREKSTEPAFDRYLFSISKKTHAGFLTKLFMRQIPKSHWEFDDNGREYYVEDENDFIPGVRQYLPFDEAWNLITKNLYNCNSYSDLIVDKDGNPILTEDGKVLYLPTSIRGMVKELAESQAFFAALDRKLDLIENNPILKPQIYATLNSQLPNMSYASLRTQVATLKAYDEPSEIGEDVPQEVIEAQLKKQNLKLLADRTKKWELRNDNTLRAARNIPRDWSKSIILRGLINNTSKGPVISSEYSKLLLRMLADLKKLIDDDNSTINDVKLAAIKLLLKMGIPADMSVLDFFLLLDFTRSGELFENSTIKSHIEKMMCQNTAGSVGYFIALISKNVGLPSFLKNVMGKPLKEAMSLDRTFVGTKLTSKLSKLALALNAIHPSTEEYAVRMPNGEMGYPNSLNNTASTETRLMNTTNGQRALDKMDDPYCAHSLICDVAKDFDLMTPEVHKLKLNLCVGMDSDSTQEGVDYFGITALEDYLINMYVLDQDPTFGTNEKNPTNNEFTHLVTPTMADKKTHYDIQCKRLRTVHDTVIWYLTDDMLSTYVEKKYKAGFDEQFRKDHPGIEKGFEFANKDYDPSWKAFLEDSIQSIKNNNYSEVIEDPNFYFRTYSEKTIRIFTNYFKDELESLRLYYSKAYILKLKEDPNSRIDNLHGTFKDGRMLFNGNGGLFRYFYDIFSVGKYETDEKGLPLKDENGDYIPKPNLNQWLEALWNILKQIESGKAIDAKTNQAIGLIDVDDSLNLDNVDDIDGFELIRLKLDALYDKYFPNGTASTELKQAINRKLLLLTIEELKDISTNTNRLLAVESGGVYFPYSIPSMFLLRQNQRLYDEGHVLGKKQYTPYSKNNSTYDAQMLFSLMANHVANTAISILEYEKVYSGDPAQYKYKYAEDKDTGERIKQKNSFVVRLGLKELRVEMETDILSDKSTDKIKRLGSLQSPGDEIFTNYTPEDVPDEQERLYLNSKHYTNLTVRDFILKSPVLESEIKPRFRKQLIIDYLRTNRIKEIYDLIKRKQAALKDKDAKYTFEHLVSDIYSNNHGIEDEVIEILKKLGAYDKITKEINGLSKPFGKVNVSDALVLLRPAFYRKIRKGLGLWSDELEEAYLILENDPDWMKKPELIEKVSKAEFYPLKMSYFNTESHEFGKGMYINRTILNKQACFPWFKYFAQSDTGRDIYNRMNMPGHEIDQLSFESAVKVGSMLNSPYAYDENKNRGKVVEIGKLGEWVNKLSANRINLLTDKEEAAASGDVLPVVVQDLTFLRYQLNTESHKDDYRAIGTLVFKIMFQNLFDKAVYGQKSHYGKEIKGEYLKTDILACIDALTQKGIDHLHKDYYYQDKNGRFIPSDSGIQKYIKRIVHNQNLGVVAENIIANGGVAECLTNRVIFEQNAVAKVNEEVIDINTQGGTAIQQSMFGFNDYTDDSVAWDGSYAKYNDGKPLRWHRDDGSIEVMLSLNFFRNVIPDYENKTQELRRQWLFDNGIIGRDSKPFGIAYRIPTQGLSSAFAMTVVDVLPNVSGDLIVLPPEITSLTGSDYDVDKMFIATLNYEDGKLIDVPEIDNKLSLSKKREFYKGLSEKQILNKLLFDYLSIITDVKSYAASRKSIDTIVSRLKDLFLAQIEPKTSKYVLGMLELLPSFQSDRKLEFKTGKDGIGPFALSITNLTLMQAVHLTMTYNDNLSQYGFLDLDCIYSKDCSYIQDWLSAMVSAHVDVAKDPYIFKLNVNKITYNHTSFLLRSGMGISTFSFLAQPILKKYANLVMQSGGIYGRMLTGSEVVNISRSKRARQIKGDLYQEYINKIKVLFDQSKDTEYESELNDIYKHALTYSSKTNQKTKKASPGEKKAVEYIERSDIFNFEKGVSAIKNSVSTASIIDLAESALFNIQCLFAFEEIARPADALSELILTSRIDTEGFGNTIATLINFDSKLKSLKYQGGSNWIIKGASPELNSTPGYALKTYFENTYLENKFYTAHSMTRQMLRRLLLSATTPYRKIFDGIGRLLNGETVLHKVLYEKDPSSGRWVPKIKKNQKDGAVQYVTEEEKIFKAFYKDESAQAVGNAIDNIARFNILMNYYKYLSGEENYRKKISDREHGVPVDLSMGGDITKVLQKIRTLILGSSEIKSLPMRFNEFFKDLLDNPTADYAKGLVDKDGVSNEFLRFLQPISKNPSKNLNIDYFSLHESAIRSSDYYKLRIISDFGVLLNHPSERVRDLATDLVFYAYYTSYDTPSRNKFFSLVPPYYRSVYDDIIRLALVGSNRQNLFTLFSTPYVTTSSANILAEEYVDIIARNYWYDDTIVQKMFENTSLNKEEPSKNSEAYEYRPDKFYWTNKQNHLKYPGLIITTNMKFVGSPIFAKITKSGYTVLYKRVGRLNISKLTNTEDGSVEYKPFANQPDIYMAVEKAGIWSNGTYLPEFFKTRQIPSIFEENKLPGNFHEGKMWEFLYDFLDKKNAGSQNKQPLFKYEVKRTERELDLDDKLLDIYYQSTYTGYVPSSQKKAMKTMDGSIIVDMAKQASPTVVNFATKIISLESDSYNDVTIPGNKRLDISDVFDSSGNINIDSVLKQIADSVNSMNTDEKSKKNRIVINLPEEKIPVTEEENSTYIERAESWYVLQNPEASEEEIEQYSNFIKTAASDQIKLIKMYQLSDLIIKALSLNGYNIELVLAARLTQNSRAALTAAKDNSELIGNPVGVQKALFRVTPKDLKTTYDSFLELLNSGIDAYTLEIPGVDYLMEAHEETLDLAELAEEETEEKKEKARQEKKEPDPKPKPSKPSQKPDFSKMTPEQILEYVMLQAAGYGVNTGASNTASEQEKLVPETEEPVLKEEGAGMTYQEAKKLTPAQVAALSPEKMLEYVNAMRNKFVNENGNKKDGC